MVLYGRTDGHTYGRTEGLNLIIENFVINKFSWLYIVSHLELEKRVDNEVFMFFIISFLAMTWLGLRIEPITLTMPGRCTTCYATDGGLLGWYTPQF